MYSSLVYLWGICKASYNPAQWTKAEVQTQCRHLNLLMNFQWFCKKTANNSLHNLKKILLFSRKKPICDSKELRHPALNASINSILYKKRENKVKERLLDRNLQIRSKLLDLEGMGGKSTEINGSWLQLSTCGVVLTVPIGAMQSLWVWAALWREARCLLLLTREGKKSKKNKGKKKQKNRTTIKKRFS